jgi:hypothetical protein
MNDGARAMGAALMLITGIACSAERYARPSGPAPRYEAAPVAPWDAGAPGAGDSLATPFDDLEGNSLHGDAGSTRGGVQRNDSHDSVQED